MLAFDEDSQESAGLRLSHKHIIRPNLRDLPQLSGKGPSPTSRRVEHAIMRQGGVDDGIDNRKPLCAYHNRGLR